MHHPGINIKLLRKARGISQSSLALLTGMSKSFLSEVENCKTEISARRLWQIAQYLQTTMDALMEMSTCPTCGQKISIGTEKDENEGK